MNKAGINGKGGSFLNIFINHAKLIHGDRYNYDKIIYKNSSTKIEIICKEHGSFFQTPHGHKCRGCPTCGGSSRLTNEIFIKKAIEIHAGKYNYDKVNYINSHTNIEIICPNHGIFYQKPNGHLSGQGCKKCYFDIIGDRNRSNTKDFLSKANIKHSNIYDYSKTIYVSNRKKVIIICLKHGEFYQTPNSHLAGQGCPKCGKIVSKSETEWLNFVGVPNDKEHRQVRINLPKKLSRKKYVIVDGFSPDSNTVFEYLGDFWHGNPQYFNCDDINPAVNKSFGELYQKTIDREQLLKNAGYKLTYIWESDWEAQCRA